MDNKTEDITPEYSNVDDPIPTKKNPSYELTIIQQSKQKLEKNGNGTKRVLNFLMVLIVMTVILLLINILLIALSVAIYTRLSSAETKILNEIDEIITLEVNRLQCNAYQNNTATCNNLSQMLLQVDTEINDLTSLLQQNTDMEQQSNYGPGLWYQVAHLNMSDPSQQCPPAWREYNTSGIRACGRPTTSTGNCATKYYLTSHQHSRVCGRVIGYQVASPDAFSKLHNEQIDFDGVNVTSGAKRDHIWSYVAGMNEMQQQHVIFRCPCSVTNGRDPPSSIGENYYCESGIQTTVS